MESRILQSKRGVPSIGMKNLSEARRYAMQLVSEGAGEAKVIENATGIVVTRYDSSDAGSYAGKERMG